VEISTTGIPLHSVFSAEVVTGPVATAMNTFDKVDAITSRKYEAVSIHEGAAIVQLPPLSIAAISFDTTGQGIPR
jgi:alpha-L-arabinofuranosidase